MLKVNLVSYKNNIEKLKDEFLYFLKEFNIKVYFSILDTMYSFTFDMLQSRPMAFDLIFKYDGFMHVSEDVSMLFSLRFSD